MRIFLLWLLGSLVFWDSFAFQIQTDSTTSASDSMLIRELVSFTPFTYKQNIKLLPFSSYYLDNEAQLENNASRSILYSQYGQSPSQMALTTNYPSIANVGWRLGGIPLLVLNGIPFNSGLNEIANLNTFDFEPALVLPGLSAAAFGAPAGNGALILMPKSGKGNYTTRVDVNSYTSIYTLQEKDSELTGASLITSLAVAKDFGKINGRISLNYGITPDEYQTFMNQINGYRKSITSFIEFAPSKKIYGSFYFQQANRNLKGINDNEDDVRQTFKHLNSHLKLGYNIIKWLKWESNLSLQKGVYEKESGITTIKYQITDKEDKRGIFNSFLTATINPKAELMISPFIGVQSENVSYENLKTITYYPKNKTKQMLTGGINSVLSDIMTMNFTYRIDKLDGYENQLSYAVNTAFDFSKYLNFSKLTLAKFRVGFGKNPVRFKEYYPNYSSYNFVPQLPDDLNNKQSIEGGLDLRLFQNNLQLSYTYFLDAYGDLNTNIIDDPFQISYYSGELVRAGHELMIKGNFEFSDYYSIKSTFLFTDYAYGPWTIKGIIPLEASIPKWKLSLLTQIDLSNFGMTVMIDQRKGGKYSLTKGHMYRDFTGNPLVLRELSMYVNLPLDKDAYSSRWRIAFIKRNLFASNGDDLEAFNGYFIQKETTVSISATF